MHQGRSGDDVVVMLLEHEAGHVRADGRVEIEPENPQLAIALPARLSAITFHAVDKGKIVFLSCLFDRVSVRRQRNNLASVLRDSLCRLLMFLSFLFDHV